ncbi:MAG: N-acetylmuramoyl-L-alanine amidase family protein [Alistipes indistinctus]
MRNTAMGNRGVKQAGFLVLWNAAMPSILTELGFISNAGDRALLTSRAASGETGALFVQRFQRVQGQIGRTQRVRADAK